MRGLMQEVSLTIDLILGRLARHSGPRKVVTGTSGESERFTWAHTGEAELTEFLRDKVAKWWIPESFEFVEQIPRTAVGKYDKRQLRERYGGRDQSAA